MNRASNTSLDERALTEAAKKVPPIGGDWPGAAEYRRIVAETVVVTYLAALPEPPLDEWLKGKIMAAEELACDAKHEDGSHPADYAFGKSAAFEEVLEALAEHRKGSGGG